MFIWSNSSLFVYFAIPLYLRYWALYPYDFKLDIHLYIYIYIKHQKNVFKKIHSTFRGTAPSSGPYESHRCFQFIDLKSLPSYNRVPNVSDVNNLHTYIIQPFMVIPQLKRSIQMLTTNTPLCLPPYRLHELLWLFNLIVNDVVVLHTYCLLHLLHVIINDPAWISQKND